MTIHRTIFAPLVLALLWLLLTQGDPNSLVIGIPFIVLAAWAWTRLSGHNEKALSVSALIRFLPWFAWNSLRGGLDVARRAVSPRLRLKPGFVSYPLNIAPGRPQVFLINCISLLPGTLSVELEGDNLIMHALDTDMDIIGDAREVERQVQALFQLPASATDA